MCLNAWLVSSINELIECANVAMVDPAPATSKYTAVLASHTALLRKYLGLGGGDGGGGRDGGGAGGGDRGGGGGLDDNGEESKRGTAGKVSMMWGEGGRESSSSSSASSASSSFDPSLLGFHAAAMVLRVGLLDGKGDAADRAACCAFIQASLCAMFPINKAAGRLSDPSKRSPVGFYTPYFQTFTFDGLFRAGHADFVLEQYREAWGWALTQSSTWLEVRVWWEEVMVCVWCVCMVYVRVRNGVCIGVCSRVFACFGSVCGILYIGSHRKTEAVAASTTTGIGVCVLELDGGDHILYLISPHDD